MANVIAAVDARIALEIPRNRRRGNVLHVAQSLVHDHLPAKELGLASCWINRQHGRIGAVGEAASRARYDFTFATMGDFAEAHRKEVGG